MADTLNTRGICKTSINTVYKVQDLYPLIGFTVAAVEAVEGDGIYLVLENHRNVAIDLLFTGNSLSVTAPYGVDSDGNRI